MTAEPLITVDPAAPVPPYVQIRDQIADLVSTGGLTAGTRLPPVRQLAADLGLAAGTVARAYQELEATGHLETRRGGGTRVAAQAGDRRDAVLRQHAADFAAIMRRLGVPLDEALTAVTDAFADSTATAGLPGRRPS
ncbi:GntR family transcriptional regulator [Asanoa sp. WMMD1127]|uniref:GntR family transcriptional regulator n=1 Tax=Asanoa sp. WMMD1127 TaxID=3016107 RepID=UPI002416B138|nr:GntR family transcriptional regulator [Asanoa sp. WMMD1127]MDG4821228.1 GntR family transcriptional regulator [Asanoa sp. WMMD1127]